MSEQKEPLAVSIEELRTRKIFVAVPMYGGMCSGQFTKSMCDLSKLCMHYGVELEYFFLFNESLIPRARNYCVDEFLRREEFTHMMFIDADISFDPLDVLRLAGLAAPGSDKDIVCAPYPKKTIAWEKIVTAVNKGFGDENPNNLQRFVGDYVFNPINTGSIPINEPVEVLEGGTGFMMIQRSVFERFAEAYPELSYLPDHVRTKHFDGTREIHAYFDTVIDPKSKRYLSEDYMFCQYARNADIKVWMCPWMKLIHMGSFFFGGSLADIAMIGAHATADPTQKIKQS